MTQYKKWIVNDPRVHLDKERKSFKIGTKQEAEQNGWVSLDNLKKELNNSEEELSQFLYSLTSFTQDESV